MVRATSGTISCMIADFNKQMEALNTDGTERDYGRGDRRPTTTTVRRTSLPKSVTSITGAISSTSQSTQNRAPPLGTQKILPEAAYIAARNQHQSKPMTTKVATRQYPDQLQLTPDLLANQAKQMASL